jgi:hypothetical protein
MFNQPVTLSFSARTSGSSIGNLKAVILSWNSTADTVTSDVVSAWGADGVTPTWATNWTAENTPQNLAPSNTWTRYSITATLDTASTNNVAVFIWCDDMTTTLGDFLYITDVQLEVGSLATPFERKPFSQVLSDCRRYYYRATANSTNLFSWFAFGFAGNSTTAAEFWFPLPMQLRTVPTAIDVANLRMTDLTGAYTIFTLTLSTVRSSTDFISLGATTAGLTPYRPLTLESNNTTAGYVGVVAEL